MRALWARRLCRVAVALALAAFGVAAHAADALFEVLGGGPGIAALVDDFVPRLAADERIGAFFKDTDLGDLKKQLVDQLCAVAGGGCVYAGGGMKQAHADMRIGRADFNRLVEVLQTSMDARSIPFAAQNRLLARLAPMHRDIVNAP